MPALQAWAAICHQCLLQAFPSTLTAQCLISLYRIRGLCTFQRVFLSDSKIRACACMGTSTRHRLGSVMCMYGDKHQPQTGLCHMHVWGQAPRHRRGSVMCMYGDKHHATGRALWGVHSLRGSAGAWMLETWGYLLHWVETVRFRLRYAYFIMLIIYRYLETDICIHGFLYRTIFHVFLSILFTYIWNFQSF